MNTPNDIEKSLQRLIPAALSERAHGNISRMIGDLTARNEVAPAPVYKYHDSYSVRDKNHISPRRKWAMIAAVAALVLFAAFPAWMNHDSDHDALRVIKSDEDATNASKVAQSPVAETILLERLSVTNHEDSPRVVRNSDGSVVEEINRKILTRERYRAGKNGYLITISESRAEKVFVPKSSF